MTSNFDEMVVDKSQLASFPSVEIPAKALLIEILGFLDDFMSHVMRPLESEDATVDMALLSFIHMCFLFDKKYKHIGSNFSKDPVISYRIEEIWQEINTTEIRLLTFLNGIDCTSAVKLIYQKERLNATWVSRAKDLTATYGEIENYFTERLFTETGQIKVL